MISKGLGGSKLLLGVLWPKIAFGVEQKEEKKKIWKQIAFLFYPALNVSASL